MCDQLVAQQKHLLRVEERCCEKYFEQQILAMLLVFHQTHNLSGSKFVDVIYQTQETVLHRDIQTPRRELKIRRAAEYF